MKYTVFSICLILLIGFSQLGFAGGQEGHGGVGIKIGNFIYLVDLVEAGVEKQPYFDSSVKPSQELVAQVDAALSKLSLRPGVTLLVAQKLAELHLLNPIFSVQLLLAMKSYTWRLVDASLINTNDEKSPIEIKPDNRVQLAVRLNKIVMMDRNAVNLLDDPNFAALIFHEIFFAYTTVLPFDNNCSNNYFVELACSGTQPSQFAQVATGYIFSIELKQRGMRELVSLANISFSRFGAGTIRMMTSQAYKETKYYCFPDPSFVEGVEILTWEHLSLTLQIGEKDKDSPILKTPISVSQAPTEVETEKFCARLGKGTSYVHIYGFGPAKGASADFRKFRTETSINSVFVSKPELHSPFVGRSHSYVTSVEECKEAIHTNWRAATQKIAENCFTMTE